METKAMAVWIVGLVLMALVLCAPVACTMNRQSLVAEAIKGGADPISAKCAIESSMDERSAVCLVKAMGGGK